MWPDCEADSGIGEIFFFFSAGQGLATVGVGAGIDGCWEWPTSGKSVGGAWSLELLGVGS